MPSSKRLANALVAGLLAATLAGCGALAEQKPGALVVRSARIEAAGGGPLLELGLDCRLSGPMQDALDHGIPLTLAVDVRAGRWPLARARATRRIELRYFPLSRRYQLRELDADELRSFATPGYLIAALGSLRLTLPPPFAELPPQTPMHVSARLDPAALPGPLRLPALFEPAWRLASAEYAWAQAR
ncbi:MAG TPA: DUF4390 domain-containing protein [Dokdonella sp.]